MQGIHTMPHITHEHNPRVPCKGREREQQGCPTTN